MNVICKFLVVKPIVETWSKGKYLQLFYKLHRNQDLLETSIFSPD